MKRNIYFTLLFLLLSIKGWGQLPLSLWDFAHTNTYMYFPEVLEKSEEFYIQTNHHFLRFNSSELKLTRFRSIASYEKLYQLSDLVGKEDDDILSMYLEYNGEKYKVIRNEVSKDFIGDWVEGGKFYQRRYISDLKLEDGGPLFRFGLEIASWNDAFSFTLDYDEYLLPEDEMSLIIELRLPEAHYEVNADNSSQIKIQSDNHVTWDLTSNKENNSISYKKGVISISSPLSNKSISALFQRRIQNYYTGKLLVYANDKNAPYQTLESFRDPQRQATVISMSGNMESKFGMERTKVVFENPTDEIQFERVIFEKKGVVKDITGASLILRDKQGFPTGIPIQISKNWHNDYKHKFKGPWLRGFTIVAIPPNEKVELELSRVTGFWGTLPAASHSQLSLTSWGKENQASHQLWEESAIGAFGENICYEPYGGIAESMITDVRPLFVKSTQPNIKEPEEYNWTPNVGGGDFLRFYDDKGNRKNIKQVKVDYIRNCPNLTEVSYKGVTANDEADYKLTTHLMRTNDFVKAYYHIELDVKSKLEFSRLAIAQFGSETYAYSYENKFAFGNENGLLKEIKNRKDKLGYVVQEINTPGAAPWVSMHDAVNYDLQNYGTWANRGLILRETVIIINGKVVKPQFSTFVHYSKRIQKPVTLMELNLPLHIKELNEGDRIDMTIELCILPNESNSYYGDNEAFKNFISKEANTWEPMYREAHKNTQLIFLKKGKLLRRNPIKVEAENDEVILDITNGLGYVPITISNISNYRDFNIVITKNGTSVNLKEQEKFGNDYWQTDYNAETKTWEVTYSVPMDESLEP
ncbi:hypothetical protein MY04_4444 [Flammeovirga sp. MY04]|uniref:hypothetical protein n=1 Tax=Flammeovirga sp. MY04 TaxID=1191459 RepID=UPI0013053F96|nr:hypothetical protein [Flammeovirga sp. MY04]ANQ51780.2 hypothetical protein MY04_4444 [Flammeovirga sp. MY04]